MANLSKIRWKDRKIFGGSITDQNPGGYGQDTCYDVIPYQYGLMRAYMQQYTRFPEHYHFLEPCFRPASVEETARHCAGADLIGYSVYIWNQEFNLAVSRRIRQLNPGAINCFGGPQVPVEAEDFLRKNPWVDIACYSEIEQSFLSVAENLDSLDWSQCPGCSWLDLEGKYQQTPASFLSSNALAACRSPYHSGILDFLLTKYPQSHWLMPLETNRGCPFKCAYCGWGASHLTGGMRCFSMERTKADLEWAGVQRIEQVLVCDANFGLLPRDHEIVDYAVDVSGRTDAFNAFAVQTACEISERVYQIHEKLCEHNISSGATVGVQSRSENVLDLCGRRFVPQNELKEILNQYARRGIETYCDIIFGLPGETYDSFASGIAELIAAGQYNNLFAYPFIPLVNTVMNTKDFQERHGLKTVLQPLRGTHTPVSQQTAVTEYMNIVVESAAMPGADWCRARAWLWLTHILFFNRLLHVPIVIGLKMLGLDFKTLIEKFLDADPGQYPAISGLSDFCTNQAMAVQKQGASDLIAAGHIRDAWWPSEQYAIIQLLRKDMFHAFYDEALHVMSQLIPGHASKKDHSLIAQSVELNHALFRVPFVRGNIYFKADFDIKTLYRGFLKGKDPVFRSGPHVFEIIRTRPEWKTWEGWYDHLMFCHNQKKYYLYGFRLAARS